MKRRNSFKHTGLVAAGLLLPEMVKAAEPSPLIYLSPIKSDGNLSRCQADGSRVLLRYQPV